MAVLRLGDNPLRKVKIVFKLTRCNQAAGAGEPLPVPRQDNRALAFIFPVKGGRELGPENRLDPAFPRFFPEGDRRIQAIGVRERKRLETESRGGLDKLHRVGRPFQQGKAGMTSQVNETQLELPQRQFQRKAKTLFIGNEIAL